MISTLPQLEPSDMMATATADEDRQVLAALLPSASHVPESRLAEGLQTYLADLSTALNRSPQPLSLPGVIHLLNHKSKTLGLDPSNLVADLRQGLEQRDALGPDELDEYQGYLLRFFPQLQSSPNENVLSILYDGFSQLCQCVVKSLLRDLPAGDRAPVFLGTDAEFLKSTYDLLMTPRTAIAHYISRRCLLTEEEAEVLSSFESEVFSSTGITSSVADHSKAERRYSWIDNSLVSTVMYQLLRDLRAPKDQTKAGSCNFQADLSDSIRLEMLDQPIQKRRLRNGWFTFFGEPHPEVDRLVRSGIAENHFSRVLMGLARRFYRQVLSEHRHLTLVDVGATGTQPFLLLALVGMLTSLTSRGAPTLPAMESRDGAMIRDLVADPPDIAVVLYCPSTREWSLGSDVVRIRPVTAQFALAVESMKTLATSYVYDHDHPKDVLRIATPAQALLAYFKHLAFRNIVLQHRMNRVL